MVSYNQITDTALAEVETEPVTLEEAKAFMRVTHSDDDDTITELITAARELCEDFTNLSFVAREVNCVMNNCNGETYLPYGPVYDGVSEITDEKGDAITDYRILGKTFPRLLYPCQVVSLTYTGGHETLPKALKTGLLNAIYFMYDNRADGDIGSIAKGILKSYRRV